jgi:hypothetical protein
MNLTSHPMARLERNDAALKLALAALAVYWICMLAVLPGSRETGMAAARLLTFPAMALMFWIACTKTTQLIRALTVLGQLLAPHRLRRQLVWEKLWFITLSWAFLATGATLQLALPQSQASALSGAALVSLAACLGMLRSLPAARRLPVPVPQLLEATPYLAALILLDFNALLTQFGNLPVLALALAALTFPCLAWWLERHWRAALPAFRWSALAPSQGITGWIAMQARRRTILTWRSGQPFQDGHASHIAPLAMRIAVLALPFIISRPVWGNGEISLHGAATLSVMAMFIAGALVVRDLHWRSFLMPGGMRPRRVASHILASTMAVQFGIVLILTLVLVSLGPLSLEAIIHRLMRSSILLTELLFATSLAMVLRAALPSVRMWATVAGAAVILLLYPMAHLPNSVAASLPVYLLALLGASMLLLVLANRLWSAEKLFVEAGRIAPG